MFEDSSLRRLAVAAAARLRPPQRPELPTLSCTRCGDWLFDNRLGLASGLRVKISQPIPETSAKWESYSKFRLGGMLSKVPKHIGKSGDPTRLQFTPSYPPYVAVSVGDKYLLTFDTTRVHEDLGLTFPDDYGAITGFRWLHGNVLMVGLTNGYVVTVDFGALIKLQQNHKLPDRVSAMCTTKVFNEYLQDISATQSNDAGQRVACCGDCAVKVIHRQGMELEVLVEVGLDRKPTIGEFLDKARAPAHPRARPCTRNARRARANPNPNPLLRRSSGTTRRQALRARRPTATCTCMSCSGCEPCKS